MPVLPGLPARVQADLAVDALLGIGVNRALDGPLAAAVNRLNDSGCPVLAVDVPSGLHSDTGAVQGAAVRAAHTLALLTLKPGLFTAQGRDHAGRLWFDDLVVAAAASPSSWPAAKRRWLCPRRGCMRNTRAASAMRW